MRISTFPWSRDSAARRAAAARLPCPRKASGAGRLEVLLCALDDLVVRGLVEARARVLGAPRLLRRLGGFRALGGLGRRFRRLLSGGLRRLGGLRGFGRLYGFRRLCLCKGQR